MADKQGGAGGESESAKLRSEIIRLASKKLEAIFSKTQEDEVGKVLDKRRRKWRKRHGLHENACKNDSQKHVVATVVCKQCLVAH